MSLATLSHSLCQGLKSVAIAFGCKPKFGHSTALFLPALLLGGCATQQIDANGYRTRSYFGLLEITERDKAAPGEVRIERVKATGLRWGAGLGVGFFDDSAITLLPDCKLIVVIKDLAQFDRFLTTYPQFNQEKNPCVRPLDF